MTPNKTARRPLSYAHAATVMALWLVADTAGGQSPNLVIRHVILIDATGAAPRHNMMVVVREGRIASVDHDTPAPTSSSAVVIDGKGKFLMPGLWERFTSVPSPTAAEDDTSH